MAFRLLGEMGRLRRQQWASDHALQAIQLAKLRRQVSRAWRYTEFHVKRLASAGFHPGHLTALSDLQKLPITTKDDLRTAGRAALASHVDLDRCVWLRTSGSTGSPMALPFTRWDKDHRVLMELRSLVANGYRFTDRMLLLVEPRWLTDRKVLPQRLGLLRREYVSIFADESEQIAKLKGHRADVIYGYTSSLRMLAEMSLATGKPLPTPRLLVTSAEPLDARTRRLLASAFGVEPVDFYGSMEFGWIGWQCPERRGYHINSDCMIVECLRNGRPAEPGEEGELVITNLHSDAAPLIRYATGDTGVLSVDRCACGRALPLLACVSGRLVDCIVAPDGRKLSPYAVTCALEGIPNIRQFQVMQENERMVRVRLVPAADAPDSGEVRRAVRAALGGQIEVSVEHADALPAEPTGKFRVVRSLLGAAETTAVDAVPSPVPGG